VISENAVYGNHLPRLCCTQGATRIETAASYTGWNHRDPPKAVLDSQQPLHFLTVGVVFLTCLPGISSPFPKPNSNCNSSKRANRRACPVEAHNSELLAGARPKKFGFHRLPRGGWPTLQSVSFSARR